MANIIINRTVSLDGPVLPEFMPGLLYMNENQAHQFVISCTRGGSAVTLTGGITGRFMRADGQTILLTGSISGGIGVLTLPRSCYIAPGRFILSIFNTTDTVTTTIYATTGNVARTQTDTLVDPGNTIPSIDELLAEIETMRAATADAVSASTKAVRYDVTQSLTNSQKTRARENIEALQVKDFTHHELNTYGANVAVSLGALNVFSHYDESRIRNNTAILDDGTIATKEGMAISGILNGATYKMDAIELPNSNYRIGLSGYRVSGYNAEYFIGKMKRIDAGKGRILYRPPEWPYVVLTLSRNPETDVTPFTNEELAEIASLITIYVYNNASDRLTEAEADINERTMYPIDVAGLKFSYGGLGTDGAAIGSYSRLRYLDENGRGAIKVAKGSKIIANTGYKFNVGMYKEYISNNNFILEDFRPIGTGEFVVPYDCYIRISFGSVNDDALWEINGDGLHSLTPAGQTALAEALTLSLYGGSIKSEIANVAASIYDAGNVVRQIDSLPLNAVDYHSQWDTIVDAGQATRSLLTYVNNDTNLPIYKYVIQSDMDHIASDYSKVTWNGSNQLYSRPKIFICSGIHGNERTTPSAVLEFVKSMLEDAAFIKLRNAFEWHIVPIVNPWGYSNTALNNGAVSYGTDYTDATKDDYTIVENGTVINNVAVHQGIRRNKDGIDINRDFSAFATEEARALRNAIQSGLTGDRYVFAMDCHQAAYGTSVNVIGAFLSMQYGATDEDKNLIYGKWMQAGAQTEKSMADYVDVDMIQSVHTWDGTNQMTARNYIANYADYSTCFEGGQTCVYYSNSTEWSNSIARAFINTQLHNFMQLITQVLLPMPDKQIWEMLSDALDNMGGAKSIRLTGASETVGSIYNALKDMSVGETANITLGGSAMELLTGSGGSATAKVTGYGTGNVFRNGTADFRFSVAAPYGNYQYVFRADVTASAITTQQVFSYAGTLM